MPRWVLYQARSLVGSLALIKTPPIPVTRFIVAFSVLSIGSEARFIGFSTTLFSGVFSEVFAPEVDSALFSGAFAPEAGSRSWAWIQQMGRVTTVKTLNTTFVCVRISSH